MKYVIKRNKEAIIERLNPEEPFITKLVNQQIISKELHAILILIASNVQRNIQLLDHILQYSDKNLVKFKMILEKDQPDISSLFEGKYAFAC